MTAAAALRAAMSAGIEVRLVGADLALSAASPPASAVLEALRRNKAGVVALLTSSAGQSTESATLPSAAPVPSLKRLVDRLTRAYAIPRPHQRPLDPARAALYWRSRATSDLLNLDGDLAAQMALVELEESRAPPYDGLVTIDFVEWDDPPTPGLEPLRVPGDPHAGLRWAAMKRPPSWSDPAARPSPGCLCSCCGLGRWWTESANPRGWRCFTCHPPWGAKPGEVTEVWGL